MEMEKVQKAPRLDDNKEQIVAEVDDETNENENDLSHMDKLPNEILIKILDYLHEGQLVKFRLLNSQWNEICCLLLQSKTKNDCYSNLVVQVRKPGGKPSLECKTTITKPLADFLNCFAPTEAEKSSNNLRPFPFSRFDIAGFQHINMDQMNQFTPLLVHVKTLLLRVDKGDLNNFGHFWRLVVKYALNIQYLGIFGDQWMNVKWIEDYFYKMALSISDLYQTQKDLVLSKLKVLEIQPRRFGDLNTVEKFLTHVPNVQKLVDYNPFYLVEVWQELNRVHLLKTLEINCSCESSLSPVDLMKNLRLVNLNATCSVFGNPIDSEKSIINYIHHALKSSQDTLTSLHINLLTMKNMNFCFKDISTLPNVRQLCIQILEPIENGVLLERFSQLCPNITSLNLGHLSIDSFSNLISILWTRFKVGLKALKCSLDLKDKIDLLTVDCAISGYSQESIQRIQSKLESGIISLEEARRGESQEPSILDLKDLSRLELEFFIERNTETEQVKYQLKNSVFVQILPQHIREYPRSILYRSQRSIVLI